MSSGPRHAGSRGTAQDVFASGAYWREYYSAVGHENRVAGEFLREVCAPLSDHRLRILDAGCGPTALYWAVFLPGIHEHHGFDLNDVNIQSSRAQIEAAKQGYPAAGLLEAAQCSIGGLGLELEAARHAADKAHQFGTLRVADLSKPWPYEAASFDLVQSCFAIECLPDWQAFDMAVLEAKRVLQPGGRLALVNVAHATNWICDGKSFATLRLTPDQMHGALDAAGFIEIELREISSQDVASREQGYSRMMLTRARKPAGG